MQGEALVGGGGWRGAVIGCARQRWRRGKQGRIVFVLNNTRERQALTLPGQFRDLLSGETVGPQVVLARNGVLILKA